MFGRFLNTALKVNKLRKIEKQSRVIIQNKVILIIQGKYNKVEEKRKTVVLNELIN